MSNNESMIRLEDGEIDEAVEPCVLQEAHIMKNVHAKIEDFKNADHIQNPPTIADLEFAPNKEIEEGEKEKQISSFEKYNFEKVFSKDQDVYIDEDEMLCVRGASPIPFVVERLCYTRKSPLRDCVNIQLETTPPKKRKTSRRRNKNRTKKKTKTKTEFLDDHSEFDNSSSQERSRSPQEQRHDKLPQVCKFYLMESCAKRSKCEYMHSEFPCKFYYMGLKCQDDTSETGCKLSHGGSLSAELVTALTRHIKTAPTDVLGHEFVEMRSKMEFGEIYQMLKNTQDNFTSTKSIVKQVLSPQNDASQFFLMLKEKLYFLNEDQLNGLKKLDISKVDDLLNLTLAQLNAIGINATQIEAIQMSFVNREDTDMRQMFPRQSDLELKQEISYSEAVSNTSRQNWYEQEEGPLVIDETSVKVDEDKLLEDDNIIDVVGDSDSDSYSNTIEEDVENVECEICTNNTHHSQYFILERNELKNNVFDTNQNEQEALEISEELQDEIKYSNIIRDDCQTDELIKNPKVLQLCQQKQDELQNLGQNHFDQEPAEQETFQSFEKQQDVNQSQNIRDHPLPIDEQPKIFQSIEIRQHQNRTQLEEKINDVTEDCLVFEEIVEKPSEKLSPNNKSHDYIDVLKEEVTPVVLEIVEEPIETISSNNESQGCIDVFEEEIQQPYAFQKWEGVTPVELQIVEKPLETVSPNNEILDYVDVVKEEITTVPLKSVKEGNITINKDGKQGKESINKNTQKCSPTLRKVIADVDLTSPKTSTKLLSPVYFKIESKRKHYNPFHTKIISPGNANTRNICPNTHQRHPYLSKPNFKRDHQMQNDSSSEDWDADEQMDMKSPPKEIASPDQSEDESTPFVADGTCPEFPVRTKNLDNYKPALEINAHLTYPPMEYKLFEIYMPEYEVNKPTFMEKLLKSNSTDPRLKKYVEKERNHGVFPKAEYSFFPPNIPQCDPRVRSSTETNCQDQYYNVSRLLYGYLQRSQWYQELKSNLKIQINHSVSDLVRALNFFHKDPSPQKIFDLFQIECAGVLLEVMRNVGIFIDVKGNITEEPNYKQLCAPLQQEPLPLQNFGNNNSVLNAKPGLLGFAPPGHSSSYIDQNQNNLSMKNENSFARQAFGKNCFYNNNNTDFQATGSTFYVGNRYPMIRNEQFGIEKAHFQRQSYKKHPKRR